MEHFSSDNQFCSYFQARILKPEKTWFIVAVLKSVDHLAFDRAVDNDSQTFEFFVPPDMEQLFLGVMNELVQLGIAAEPVKMSNRLEK